jgi:hypothetical protein
MRMRTGVTALAIAVACSARVDAGEALLQRIDGVYISAEMSGWLLKLQADGSVVLSLEDFQLRSKAVVQGSTVGLQLPRPLLTEPPFPPPIEEPWPWWGVVPRSQPRSTGNRWPPSLEDPTAPVVMPLPPTVAEEPPPTWLTPVDWDGRRYLVRDVKAFCGDILKGLEPRTVAEGTAWLRQGDHLKPVKHRAPRACSGKM